MLTVVGIVVLAVAMLLSIALHEIGHLVPAKRFGVKVTQYMVGFGPTLWSRTRGETEYGVKWIPLGGYIRMIGMFPPKPGEDPNLVRASSTGPWQNLMNDARRQSLEEVGPGDEDRVFYKLPVRQKVVVMLGGPSMNLLLAVLFLALALCGVGRAVVAPTTTVGAVSECVAPATQTACTPTDPKAPALAAGVRTGDRIVAFDGAPVKGWDDLQQAIRSHGAGPATLVVERGGARKTLTVDLKATQRPTSATDSTPVTVGFLGVSPKEVVTGRETLPVTQLPGVLGDYVTQTVGAVFNIPAKMVGVWHAAFGGGQRDLNGPISVVGVSRIGGEVAAAPSLPLYDKIGYELTLIAGLNMALFVFNLVPLLPLDGGHVAGALFEGARRQVARWRGRPNPGYVDVAKMLPVAYGVATLLIGMSVLLIYADIVNPVRFNS